MNGSALKVDLSQVNGSAFLKVEGDIDAHSAIDLRAALDGLHADAQVILDMSGVRFMDSSGINALLGHVMRTEGTGGSLRIVNASGPVQRVIEITGLDQLLSASETDCSHAAALGA
jgi:anti-anti-sigma factor